MHSKHQQRWLRRRNNLSRHWLNNTLTPGGFSSHQPTFSSPAVVDVESLHYLSPWDAKSKPLGNILGRGGCIFQLNIFQCKMCRIKSKCTKWMMLRHYLEFDLLFFILLYIHTYTEVKSSAEFGVKYFFWWIIIIFPNAVKCRLCRIWRKVFILRIKYFQMLPSTDSAAQCWNRKLNISIATPLLIVTIVNRWNPARAAVTDRLRFGVILLLAKRNNRISKIRGRSKKCSQHKNAMTVVHTMMVLTNLQICQITVLAVHKCYKASWQALTPSF